MSFMRHTPRNKVHFILRKYKEGETSHRQICKLMRISKATFHRIINKYTDIDHDYKIKYLKVSYRGPGQPVRQLPNAVLKKIIEARLLYKTGAVSLEELLMEKEGIKVSHNIINSVLSSANMTRSIKTRGKRRYWVRWERKHSLSLWQTDWTLLGKQWLIVFIDDASRLVVGWGIFDSATSENSVKVLKEAIKAYGRPRNILTGRDTQFYATTKDGRAQGETYFQKFLKANKIKHILARVNHPQTCGKVERFFGEVKNRIRWKDFDNVDDIIRWHNEIKPHGSLRTEICETPRDAFLRKRHSRERSIRAIVEV